MESLNLDIDIYTTDEDDFTERIREQSGMSWLILHSPSIFAVIAFIVGIFIFAGNKDNQGGFDI